MTAADTLHTNTGNYPIRVTGARRSRFLLACSASLLVLGAVVHAMAFRHALSAIAASDLPPFYSRSMKALWLSDSTTLFCVALAFVWIAIRPASATRPVVFVLSLIVGAIAILLYTFLGRFLPAHLLTVAAGLGLGAAWSPGFTRKSTRAALLL